MDLCRLCGLGQSRRGLLLPSPLKVHPPPPWSRGKASGRTSRIGQKVLRYPPTVSLDVVPYTPALALGQVSGKIPWKSCTQQVRVAGPLGTLSLPIEPYVSIAVAPSRGLASVNSEARVLVPSPDRRRAMVWGTTRALLANMISGVSAGVTVPVRLVGVGYRALLLEEPAGDPRLSLRLGYSHPILLPIPPLLSVSTPSPQHIVIKGIDLRLVTGFASRIRQWRPPEPYNQKGVFVGDETIKKKEGKKR